MLCEGSTSSLSAHLTLEARRPTRFFQLFARRAQSHPQPTRTIFLVGSSLKPFVPSTSRLIGAYARPEGVSYLLRTVILAGRQPPRTSLVRLLISLAPPLFGSSHRRTSVPSRYRILRPSSSAILGALAHQYTPIVANLARRRLPVLEYLARRRFALLKVNIHRIRRLLYQFARHILRLIRNLADLVLRLL